MAFFLAVANRKGGVGKSTVAVMLAHALAVHGGKRVLVLDHGSLIASGTPDEVLSNPQVIEAYIGRKRQ